MAKSDKTPAPSIDEIEEGAPIPEGAIDPKLIKLRRTRARIGVITSAGILILCVYFLLRLSPDRKFGGQDDEPTAVAVSDVLGDRIAPDDFVELEAIPLMSHAVRSVKSKGDLGLRVVPVRGTGDRLWLALPGDGWTEPATTGRYRGRLRKLGDMALANSVREYVASTPQPVFATAAATRAGLASGKVQLVTGETVTLSADQRVSFDVVDPSASVIIGSFTERLPDARAWGGALHRAKISAKPGTPKPVDAALRQVRFDAALSQADAEKKLEAAELFGARVEPVVYHRTGTWAELQKSGGDGLSLGGASTPDGEIDLVGIYVTRPIPDDAYALITGEVPQDYWYVMPVTVALALIGLLFAWALVRAIRRDLLPTRTAAGSVAGS